MDQEHPYQVFPLVARFLSLSDVLNLRLSCTEILSELHEEVGPDQCSRWLNDSLQRSNAFLFRENWKNASNQVSILSDEASSSFTLDQLIRYLRILTFLPKQVAVCYNGKYGRHCIPWESGDIDSYPYQRCPRGKKNCETCRMKLPARRSTTTEEEAREGYNLDTHFAIMRRGEISLDLDNFYVTCVPNLPHTICCPVCRKKDKRTLLLSGWSYQSEAGTERRLAVEMKLTFTPKDDVLSKRPRVATTTTTAAFPPSYREMFIPDRDIPLQHTDDCKHAISIHCTGCNQFGILAPAGFCCQPEFPCQNRGRALSIDTLPTTVGGILQRETCSREDCQNPTLCQSCSLDTFHRQFPVDGGGPLPKKTSCGRCKKKFCWEHEMDAWKCCPVTTSPSRNNSP